MGNSSVHFPILSRQSMEYFLTLLALSLVIPVAVVVVIAAAVNQ